MSVQAEAVLHLCGGALGVAPIDIDHHVPIEKRGRPNVIAFRAQRQQRSGTGQTKGLRFIAAHLDA